MTKRGGSAVTANRSPGVHRRRLAAAIRRLRAESGLTAGEVAKRMGWSAGPRLTRMERNEWKFPKRDEIARLLDIYDVPDEQREHLLSLAEESRGRSDWHQYADLFPGSLPDLEAEATRIRSYEALAIPGLLQTPSYSKAIFESGGIVPAEDTQRKVESRMARRSVLDAPSGPQLICVIDEAALRRVVGSAEVMAEQLRFLQGMAAHYKVTLLVVPFDAGAHTAMDGAFSLIDFPSPEPGIVSISTGVESLYVEDEAYVDRHTLIFDAVHNLALAPRQSLDYIGSIAAEYDK
ncbi:helix-turn-helix domain-containing protein [Spiractinospora alimapuensis]|uniref:helix-turn-helix domain-containing protein n=1 Tax=Spiractinospora alimapuensis TaxID=2820884 RepID=UPI001F421A3E|nr:helix-turn-helix transcriptional regulator [Spiractinospora alimapuensis]QVQ52800.1 helix-turn-helix domain-containing protein [Spiractinospora alimapuensis]